MKKLLLLFCIILLEQQLHGMEASQQPRFSIERYEDYEDGTITYVHDYTDKKDREDSLLGPHHPIKHFWYYGATYNPNTKTYRSFDDGVTTGSYIVRRPFHAATGPTGSHAAQCYETLAMRYLKQEASKPPKANGECPSASAHKTLSIWSIWTRLGWSYESEKK